MNISVNAKELEEILELTPESQNILLVGRHGIGKSEILTHHFEKKGKKVIPLFLGQMADPGDLIGLPHFDEKTHRTEFLPPYWFPVEGEPVVLFLDELNRARSELMQSVMDLTLNKKLAGKSLPKGSQIIAAVNAGDEYQVEELDPALVSRFNVYYFNPDVKDWLNWAAKSKLDERVLTFIRQNPLSLDGSLRADDESENNFAKTPDRRAWKKVSDLIKNIPILMENHIKLLAGIIGEENAVNFILACRSEKRTQVDLGNFWNSGNDYFNALIILKLNDFTNFIDNVFALLVPISPFEQDKINHAKKFDDFVEWLSNSNKNEEFAYLISVFSDNKYPEANKFINERCQKAKEKMQRFVESYDAVR